MILTGNSPVNERLDMTRSPKINGQSPLRKRDANRPSARQRIFDTASELFYLKGIRNFPSKDELVAEWLREHDANFWKTWDAMASRHPKDPRRQIKAAFALLAKHVADPKARGCPMANTAVELTEKDHPARKVIEAHKAKLRSRLVQMCTQMEAPEPRLLADQLFLLMEGAQVTTQTLGARGPARSIARAAKMLIDANLRAS